jgi:PmbA protein
MLAQGVEYPYELTGNRIRHENHIPQESAEDAFRETTEAVLYHLRTHYPRFSFSNQCSISESEISLSNEAGLDLSWKNRTQSIVLLFQEMGSGSIMDGYIAYEADNPETNAALAFMTPYLDAYEHRVELPKKSSLPVIFISDDGLTMRKIGRELSGLQLATGGSLLSGKSGQKLFADSFTLSQSRHGSDNIHPFFDFEGAVMDGDRMPLIENGVFLKGYTDKKTAALYNLPYTGSASGAYDYVPIIGQPLLRITPSGQTIRELLGGEPGVLVHISSGGDYTPDGKLGAPVQLAYLYDGERILGRLPELNIASNMFDMFGSAFRGVSKDTIYPGAFSRWVVIDMAVSKM